jgi:hypothetical protein
MIGSVAELLADCVSERRVLDLQVVFAREFSSLLGALVFLEARLVEIGLFDKDETLKQGDNCKMYMELTRLISLIGS